MHTAASSFYAPYWVFFDSFHPSFRLCSPRGHEGGHVQLQRKGDISSDLPPQFGRMLKPLRAHAHIHELEQVINIPLH